MFDHPHSIDPRSEERRFEHAAGSPTVVLLHGLTATPHQYDALAPRLHARGRNVLVPRLPKHGYHNRMTAALADLEIAELIAVVKVALADARAMGGPVTVAGFSLGGLLAAYAAQREQVDRAVCIAPFLGIRWLPRALSRNGGGILRHVPDVFLWWNPITRERCEGRDGYPRYPISAVRKAFVLTDALFEDARLRAPTARSIALLTNSGESTCHNGIARELAAIWRSHGADVTEQRVPGRVISHDFMTPHPGREALRERVYPGIVGAILG